MPEASRIARRLSTLVDMGFERVEAAPVSNTVRLDRRSFKASSETPAMGTLVSMVAVVDSADRAAEAIGRAFEEMRRLIGVFSRFEETSAVTCLNDHGEVVGAPRVFCDVIAHSLRYHQLSRGAFDISVEPVVELFRTRVDSKRPRVPTPREIGEALELVGSNNISLADRKVRFKKSGMGITLDGIAKGYIVDAMARRLEMHGIKNYLINAGGDIRASGTRDGTRPWTIAVQDPTKRGRFPDLIHLNNAAVATSGSYEIYFDRDRLFHHIVSATSGGSPNRITSVSVVAPSSMAADALATSVFVLDAQRGIEFIDSLPGCACLVVDKDGLARASTHWKSAAPVYKEEAES